MKALVEVDELLERLVVGPMHDLGGRLADLVERLQGRLARPALGREPGRGALGHAAELDRIADVGRGELPHRITRGNPGRAAGPRARAPPARAAAASATRPTARPGAARTSSPPASNSPLRISSRRRSSARVIWVLLLGLPRTPLTSLLGATDAGESAAVSSPQRLHANQTIEPPRTLILDVVLGPIAYNFVHRLVSHRLAKPWGGLNLNPSRRRRSVKMYQHVPRVRSWLVVTRGS